MEIRAYHVVMALMLAGISAAYGQGLQTRPRALNAHAVTASPLSALVVRDSEAADGSTLTFRLTNDGLAREIRFPDGTLDRTIFKLFNAKFGTISEDEGTGDISGLFAIEGTTLRVVHDWCPQSVKCEPALGIGWL